MRPRRVFFAQLREARRSNYSLSLLADQFTSGILMKQEPVSVETIFSKAAAINSLKDRDAFLEEACHGDAELRSRVDALLDAHNQTNGFMAAPVGVVRLNDETSNSETPIAESPGDFIGPYKLLQEIGEGGMGVVFMAEQKSPVRRKVALKIVKPGLDTRDVIARFEAERQALALMDHPNIARVLDAGSEKRGRPFFVMELVHGISITEYCNQAKLTTRDRLKLFIPVCHAVQHAHQKGIIHRDIKPSNILVTLHDGKPIAKVIDFGIAKAVDCRLTEKTLFTRFGEFIGTPAYMSPEQTQLSGLDVDTRSDVYALGALLYELISGVPPFGTERFSGSSHDEVIRIIRDEDPPKPSAMISTLGAQLPTIAENRKTEPQLLENSVRGELDWIVMQAMEKDRTQRYESASDLARDIERYLDDEIVTARPPSTSYRMQKFFRRHWVAVAVSLAFTTVLVAATVVSGVLAWKANDAARAAKRMLMAEAEARREADAERENARVANATAEAEAIKAKREAAISSAVATFLNKDLLAQANPANHPNRNVTLRTVLDRAAARIDGKFEDPIVEAAVRSTIGETYRQLTEYKSAERHLVRAWDLYRDKLGNDSAESLAATNRLARLYIDQGKLVEVDKLLTGALSSGEKTLGLDHPDVLESMTIAALLHHNRGQYHEAEILLTSVLARRRRLLGDSHRDTLMATNDLAYVFMSQGRYDKARPMLLDTFERILKQKNEWHPDSIAVAYNLASLHRSQGRVEEARDLEKKVLERVRSVFGEQHQKTLICLNNLAMSYFDDKNFEDAEPLFQKVLETQLHRLGEDHPDTLTTMHNLASLLQDLNRSEEAEAMYLKAWRGRRLTLGDIHPDTLATQNNLAYFYLTEARYEDAAPHYKQAATLTADRYGPDHLNTIISSTMHGYCQLQQGNPELAETIFRRVLSTGSIGSHHWLRYSIESMLGESLMLLGNLRDSEVALERSLQGLTELQGQVPKQWSQFGVEAAQKRLAKLRDLVDDDEATSEADDADSL